MVINDKNINSSHEAFGKFQRSTNDSKVYHINDGHCGRSFEFTNDRTIGMYLVYGSGIRCLLAVKGECQFVSRDDNASSPKLKNYGSTSPVSIGGGLPSRPTYY